MNKTKLATQAQPLNYKPVRARYLPDEEAAKLMTLFAEGDQGAFETIVLAYKERLLYFIRMKVQDETLAEDLLQDTFERVARHARNFDSSLKFSTWVYTIADNIAKNKLRSWQYRNIIPFGDFRGKVFSTHVLSSSIQDHETCADKELYQNELRTFLEKLISSLVPEQQQAIRLRYFEDKSQDEIAVLLGCCVGTVKSRLHRARAHLAELIEPWVD